jgi:hypothetical protein
VEPATFLRIFPTEGLAFDVVIALIDRTVLCLVREHIVVRGELLAIAFTNKFIAFAERTVGGVCRLVRVMRVGTHGFLIKY